MSVLGESYKITPQTIHRINNHYKLLVTVKLFFTVKLPLTDATTFQCQATALTTDNGSIMVLTSPIGERV